MAKRRTVLIIDDDEDMRGLLERFLTARDFTVITSGKGMAGVTLARDAMPELILLDAVLPDVSGDFVCATLKKNAATRNLPIIMMSGLKIEDDDVVAGLDHGADDYISKPFSFEVFLSRIHAVMRRFQTSPALTRNLRQTGLSLDAAARTVKVGRRTVPLTRKEFDLLSILISKSGKVLAPTYLLQDVWGYDPAVYNDPATLEVHISRLRKKLGPKIAKSIVTVIGLGYKFI